MSRLTSGPCSPGNVKKDDGLIVDRAEGILLYGGFLFFSLRPSQSRDTFDIWICAHGGRVRKGRERVKQMSKHHVWQRAGSPRPTVVLRWYQWDVKIIKPPCIYVAHLSLQTLCASQQRVFSDLRLSRRVLNGLSMGKLAPNQTGSLPMGTQFTTLNLSSMVAIGSKGC